MITDFPPDRPQPPAWLTVPLSRLYGLAAQWYHRHYDRAEPFRPPVPVISVGNITIGGSGKTPTVIALARLIWRLRPELRELNKLAILSRGYGRVSRELVVVSTDSGWEEAGDEPLLIKRALPECAVIVHADRARAARHAVSKLDAKCILLDDGFQHRWIARNLDIVLVDGENPLGNGRLLPAGPLREPLENLRRASLITGVGTSTGPALDLARNFKKPFVSATPQVRLPSPLTDGTIRRVAALASIARPERFIKTLKDSDLEIVSQELFADHHRYSLADLESVAKRARSAGADAVVTTEKDKMRIPAWRHLTPLLVAGLEIQFEDETSLNNMLIEVLTRK